MRRLDLDYMHARYFSAHLGRFQSVDPVGGAPGLPQSWNRYTYVLGNPMKYTDPRGLFPGLFQPFDQFAGGFLSSMNFMTVTGSPFLFSPGWASIPFRGPRSTSSGPAFVLGVRDRVLRRPMEQRSASLVQQIFCPGTAQGISGDLSTINPWSSGGGGIYGLNLQYIPGEGLALYGYVTPRNQDSIGFEVGLAATVNQAIGKGPWTGDFLAVSGAVTPAAMGGFGTPSDQVTAESAGWHGLQAGFSAGPPGLGVTSTNYSKLVDLSFLIPWCQ